MPRLLIILCLEAYAVGLAFWQWSIGVRTDEAKYLMDIPYPHPPAARFVMSLTDGWTGQELFWRLVFATLMIQAVWLVWDLTAELRQKRGKYPALALAMAWLLSSAVVVQAGTVMMAPLTALQGLMFLWIALRKRDMSDGTAGVIGLFWLLSLFTAYQAVLFGPVVWLALRRTRSSFWVSAAYLIIPVSLLCLYTLTNPLAAASIVGHAGNGVVQPLLDRILSAGMVCLLGGSIVLSILGTIGLAAGRRWEIICSFLLVCAYVFLSQHSYYAILFLPFFIAGSLEMMRRFKAALWLLLLVPIGTVVMLLPHFPSPPNIAAEVLDSIRDDIGRDTINIKGSFGHEWQYGFHTTRIYDPSWAENSAAVICLSNCSEMTPLPDWEQRHGNAVEVWLRPTR